jgi:hypothetical protein
MKKTAVKLLGCLFFCTVLIISCAGTELTQTPVDDGYTGKPVSNILIIAITGNEHNRRSYEKKFVAQLKSMGVEAVSSEAAIPMPPDLEMKKEMILNAANQYKNDAVIITHLIGKEGKEVYNRGSSGHRGFFGFYHSRFSSPGYSSTSTTVRLETNLYDVKTEKLIWSGKSKTLSKDSTDQIINDVIKAVINNLQKNKLIAPK